VDPNDESTHEFHFALKGFRKFDLSTVSVAVSGVDVEISRVPSRSIAGESSREVCTIVIKDAGVVNRPQVVMLTATGNLASGKARRIEERLVVLRKEAFTVSPDRPTVVNGEIVLFVRLSETPRTDPTFVLLQDAVSESSSESAKLSSRLYRVKFSPERFFLDRSSDLKLSELIDGNRFETSLAGIHFPGAN
jgi:hypothetical protein